MPCTGCEWCRSGRVPEFADDDEAAAFWAEHEPEQFGLATRKVRLGEKAQRRRKLSVTMLMDPWLKQALEELASRRGVGYQTLARMWLAERVQQELQKQP
ncbi:MAG TPA: CopG family antitoxin [Candidatus Nitrosotenuis sp.]|nr:CopG family antitoxin [Candidatus Nitrosotenuis sp.]